MSKLEKSEKIAIGAVALMIIIAFAAFLFSPNSAVDHTTGAQVLKHEGGGFWLGMILSLAGAAACVFFAVRNYNRTGNEKTTLALIIAAIVFISIAFGKGCTDKANQGVTTKGGRVESTR